MFWIEKALGFNVSFGTRDDEEVARRVPKLTGCTGDCAASWWQPGVIEVCTDTNRHGRYMQPGICK